MRIETCSVSGNASRQVAEPRTGLGPENSRRLTPVAPFCDPLAVRDVWPRVQDEHAAERRHGGRSEITLRHHAASRVVYVKSGATGSGPSSMPPLRSPAPRALAAVEVAIRLNEETLELTEATESRVSRLWFAFTHVEALL